MEKIKLEIYGNPIALKRHRTYRSETGANINIDPSKSDKEVMLWKAIAQKKPKKPFDCPLKLTCIFYMPRPKSHFGTGKNSGVIKAKAPVFHTSKPDNDNLQKFILDALNGIYWKDDSIVSTIISRKVYSNDLPRTKIIIERDFLNK